MKKFIKKDNNGFTLVELIVVLVILAILAAVIVPALVGYIDEANNKQKVLNAKNIINATQTELTKLYAKQDGVLSLGTNVIPDVLLTDNSRFSGKNGDTDLRGKPFADRVLNLVDMNGDNKPYCLIIGLGSNCANNVNNSKVSKTTKHDKYTIFYMLYIEKKGDDYLYYYNGEWTTINPTLNGGSINDVFNSYNYVSSGALKDKRIQYYLLSYGGTYNFLTKTFWDKLKAGEA